MPENRLGIQNPARILKEIGRIKFLNSYEKSIIDIYEKYYLNNCIPNKCKMGEKSIFINCEGSILRCPFREDLIIKDYLHLSKKEFNQEKEKFVNSSTDCLSSKCMNLAIDYDLIIDKMKNFRKLHCV